MRAGVEKELRRLRLRFTQHAWVEQQRVCLAHQRLGEGPRLEQCSQVCMVGQWLGEGHRLEWQRVCHVGQRLGDRLGGERLPLLHLLEQQRQRVCLIGQDPGCTLKLFPQALSKRGEGTRRIRTEKEAGHSARQRIDSEITTEQGSSGTGPAARSGSI